MAYTILADLKRVTREYATAAMESACPTIRQMFSQLLNNTLRMQGELYAAMQEHNMYNASSPVMMQEIDKQSGQYRQTQQKTAGFVQQHRAVIHQAMMQQQGMMRQPERMSPDQLINGNGYSI